MSGSPKLKKIFEVLSTVLVLLAQACYEDSLTIQLLEGSEIPWDSYLPLKVRVVEQGEDPASGAKVNLITTVGSFEPYEPDGVTEPVRTRALEIHAGQGVFNLYSFPGEGGRFGVLTAAYTTIGNIKLTDRVELTAAEGGAPTSRGLTALCDPKNIAALADTSEANGMRVRCLVRAQDLLGGPIPNLAFNTLLETGGCVMNYEGEKQAGEYEFSLTPACHPMDVLPLPSEPNHAWADRIHNPRDGLMTIVFHAPGMEGFSDTNANGTWDKGELFDDLAEPFVDADDDGSCGTDEPYVDVNHDGQWSPANGQWDKSTEIWTTAHILFSGPPHESVDTTHFEPAGFDIANNASQTLSLFLVDVNHNPIAANVEGDGITFGSDLATIDGEAFVALENTLGVDFTGDGRIDITSFTRYRTYPVTLVDPDPEQNQAAATSLTTQVRLTPAPAFLDYQPTSHQVDLTEITGTVR